MTIRDIHTVNGYDRVYSLLKTVALVIIVERIAMKQCDKTYAILWNLMSYYT